MSARKEFHISMSTLHNVRKGKHPHKLAAQQMLTDAEEALFENHLVTHSPIEQLISIDDFSIIDTSNLVHCPVFA